MATTGETINNIQMEILEKGWETIGPMMVPDSKFYALLSNPISLEEQKQLFELYYRVYLDMKSRSIIKE